MKSYQGKNDNQVYDSENLVMSTLGILFVLVFYFLVKALL